MFSSHSAAVARGAVVALLLVTPAIAAAQPDTIPNSINLARLRTLCWREVRPEPRCRAWIATQFAYQHPITSTRYTIGGFRDPDFDPRLAVLVGPMFNRGPKSAVGAVVGVTADADGPVVLRAEGRYRRWLGSRTGLDISAGFAQNNVPALEPDEIRARGITAGIGLEHRWLGIDAHVDWLNADGRPRRATFVGAHVSSSGSAIAAGGFLLAGLIAFVVYMQ